MKIHKEKDKTYSSIKPTKMFANKKSENPFAPEMYTLSKHLECNS